MTMRTTRAAALLLQAAAAITTTTTNNELRPLPRASSTRVASSATSRSRVQPREVEDELAARTSSALAYERRWPAVARDQRLAFNMRGFPPRAGDGRHRAEPRPGVPGADPAWEMSFNLT